MSDASTEEIEIKALVETYWSFRMKRYMATCRALNLSAWGKTAEEAEEKFSDLLAVYVSKMAREKRLQKMRSQLPAQESEEERK